MKITRSLNTQNPYGTNRTHENQIMRKHQIRWVYKCCEKHIIMKMDNQAQYWIHQNMNHKWILKSMKVTLKH